MMLRLLIQGLILLMMTFYAIKEVNQNLSSP